MAIACTTYPGKLNAADRVAVLVEGRCPHGNTHDVGHDDHDGSAHRWYAHPHHHRTAVSVHAAHNDAMQSGFTDNVHSPNTTSRHSIRVTSYSACTLHERCTVQNQCDSPDLAGSPTVNAHSPLKSYMPQLSLWLMDAPKISTNQTIFHAIKEQKHRHGGKVTCQHF